MFSHTNKEIVFIYVKNVTGGGGAGEGEDRDRRLRRPDARQETGLLIAFESLVYICTIHSTKIKLASTPRALDAE